MNFLQEWEFQCVLLEKQPTPWIEFGVLCFQRSQAKSTVALDFSAYRFLISEVTRESRIASLPLSMSPSIEENETPSLGHSLFFSTFVFIYAQRRSRIQITSEPSTVSSKNSDSTLRFEETAGLTTLLLRRPVVPTMSFSGRRALVTGGSSGIGEGVCRALAEEGAQVIVASTGLERATKVAQSLPGKLFFFYYQCDLSFLSV